MKTWIQIISNSAAICYQSSLFKLQLSKFWNQMDLYEKRYEITIF